VGFIHCSRREQVAKVASTFYRGRSDLLLLEIDPLQVGAEIRYENLEDGGELFPHLYGPLPVRAVVRVTPLGKGASPKKAGERPGRPGASTRSGR
jgi:uncharacterized protein (DUF952 family)